MTLFEFIKIFPDHWPHPDRVSVIDYHDNDHSLDWTFENGKKISISVSSSGNLTWDAVIGSKNVKGRMNNPKEIPQEIYDIFKQFGCEREK